MATNEMIQQQMLDTYVQETETEWKEILSYWINNTQDKEYGGFYGSVNNENIAAVFAPKGLVLNCRILWSFSTAYIFFKNEAYLNIATQAYDYIIKHFVDDVNGGVYWSVNYKGEMLDGRKQIYGLGFCIYGMSEYYKATKTDNALALCKQLFFEIEAYSFDKINGGYAEAFTQNWKAIDDLRLSEKDENEKKTMNTHLHIIEGYANLYTVWPDNLLKQKIIELLNIFDEKIINKNDYHLQLFFDDKWQSKSALISYGHDVEAAWLLQECAVIINNEIKIDRFKTISIALAEAAIEGLDKDGGLWYEFEPDNNQLIKEKHSWPQAEAMVGFFNAFEITGKDIFLNYSLRSWDFVKKYIKDNKNGEWFWGIKEDYTPMPGEDKAGFWKCPYHNSRACLEIIHRIKNLK